MKQLDITGMTSIPPYIHTWQPRAVFAPSLRETLNPPMDATVGGSKKKKRHPLSRRTSGWFFGKKEIYHGELVGLFFFGGWQICHIQWIYIYIMFFWFFFVYLVYISFLKKLIQTFVDRIYCWEISFGIYVGDWCILTKKHLQGELQMYPPEKFMVGRYNFLLKRSLFSGQFQGGDDFFQHLMSRCIRKLVRWTVVRWPKRRFPNGWNCTGPAARCARWFSNSGSYTLCLQTLGSHTRWAPTSWKWSYSPYKFKWPYKWVTLLKWWLFHPIIRGVMGPSNQ